MRSSKVAIIIVSYNVADFIEACLESVFSLQTRFSYEVWIVDNQSTDHSLSIIEKKYPQVNLIKSPQNVGFAAANNLAIQKCRSDYIWLLNPDTVVDSLAMDILVNFLNNHEDYGCCGSRLLNPDGSLQISTFPFPNNQNEFLRLTHFDKFFKTSVYQMHHWDTDQPQDVDINQGASLMVRRFVFDQIGFFDEQFFMYTEEVDFCYRLSQAGWKNAWVPQSKVLHYGGLSTRQNKTAMFLQLYQTKIQFFRKHYSSRKIALYKSILWIAAVLRIIPLSVLLRIKNDPTHKNLMQNYQKLLQFLPEY